MHASSKVFLKPSWPDSTLIAIWDGIFFWLINQRIYRTLSIPACLLNPFTNRACDKLARGWWIQMEFLLSSCSKKPNLNNQANLNWVKKHWYLSSAFTDPEPVCRTHYSPTPLSPPQVHQPISLPRDSELSKFGALAVF